MEKKPLPHDHGHTVVEGDLLKQISAIESFGRISDIFKLLGDNSRLRIFWLLCHCEECVVNISAIMEMSSPAVSHHLKQLKEAGLISGRREGKEVYYRASDVPASTLLHKVIEEVMEISCPQLSHMEEEMSSKYESGSRGKTKQRKIDGYNSEQTELIRQIHDYLLENLDKRITVEDLSHKFPMNSTTIKKLFKSEYGHPIALHMKEHRMRHAAFLLVNSSQSIADIAKAVGYASQSKFIDAFRDICGMLPSEYRKAL